MAFKAHEDELLILKVIFKANDIVVLSILVDCYDISYLLDLSRGFPFLWYYLYCKFFLILLLQCLDNY